MKNYILIFCIFILFILSCENERKRKLSRELQSWQNKEIIFSPNLQAKILGKDTIIKIDNNKLKIINYIDTSGCTECRLELYEWSKKIEEIKGYTIKYGNIVDGENVVDEVLVSYFKEPKSYTTENMCEINSHGGNVIVKKILELCLKNGAELAQPGEFTKRAFLNGRIDLTESEGVMDLINSETELTRKMAINELSGNVSRLITDTREDIISLISNIEVNIDYPEYEDIEVLTNESILPDIKKFKEKLEEIIKKSEDSKVIKEGIRVGIIGRPNVGKSSLLNSLLEEEKAIVTDVPGTTRDIVEGSLIVSGIPLNIIDTAGIRKTEDTVEKIGVEKSLKIIDTSDLLIYILNNNEEITEEEKEILEKTKNKKRIIVVNKIDLKTKLNKKLLDSYIEISVKENIGIDKIKDEIKRLFNIGEISTNDMTYLSNARSIALLKKSLNNINDAINEINNNNPIDIVELSLKESWNNLGEVIGETYTDELLDELFSRFCLGK